MSWQDYVDNQLMASQCVNKACIAGHDGNIWASSKGFEVSPTSILAVHTKYNDVGDVELKLLIFASMLQLQFRSFALIQLIEYFIVD